MIISPHIGHFLVSELGSGEAGTSDGDSAASKVCGSNSPSDRWPNDSPAVPGIVIDAPHPGHFAVNPALSSPVFRSFWQCGQFNSIVTAVSVTSVQKRRLNRKSPSTTCGLFAAKGKRRSRHLVAVMKCKRHGSKRDHGNSANNLTERRQRRQRMPEKTRRPANAVYTDSGHELRSRIRLSLFM